MARAARCVRLLSARPAVAVVGVGRMGAPIARRVIDADHEVVVVDASASATAPFRSVAVTPTEAAGRADVVLLVVADGLQLSEVALGSEGVLGPAPGP